MNDSMTTRPSLLIRLHDARDEQAWVEFTAIYGPFVARLARSKGLQEADAADLVQEVFQSMATAVQLGSYDPAKGSFRGWMFTVARNKMLNFLAAGRKNPAGTGDTEIHDLLGAHPAPSPEDSALFDAEYRRRLFDWAAEIVRAESTQVAWRAFQMAGIEGQPAAVVAKTLGTTVGTVYYYKSRIMARLRLLIEGVPESGLPEGTRSGNA
jgi:RNA polymerase sigma factor (sigma-70 family)